MIPELMTHYRMGGARKRWRANFLDQKGKLAPKVEKTGADMTTAAIREWRGGPGGFRWRHFDLSQDEGRAGLQAVGLDGMVHRALVAEETRPRCTVHGDGVIINLRGVNLNPGAEPEDMVSIRLWVTEREVVSAQFRRLMAVSDVMEAMDRGGGAGRAAELVAQLALRLADRAEPVVAALNEDIDALENDVSEGAEAGVRAKLADLRLRATVLRRYMFPQRDALSTLEIEALGWVGPADRPRLREATERVTRLAEELDAIRDRAGLVQERIADARAERMNRQMLVLSVVAAFFLPLGLLTGLLGINVAGMPGTETSWAFWAVSGLLVVLSGFQAWLFWWIGLIGRRHAK